MSTEPLDDGRLEWAHVRVETIERFKGQAPRADDEARVIDHFERAPVAVLAAIDQVADALASGKVTWAWSALAGRLERQGQAVRDASVSTGPSREAAVARAEAYVRSTLVHFDRVSEVELELFGDAVVEPCVAKDGVPITSAEGPLSAWREDEGLRARMVALWRQERPRGERVEAEAVERGLRFQAQRARFAADRRRAVEVLEAGPVISDPDPEPVVVVKRENEEA